MAEAAMDEQNQPSERMSSQELASQMFGQKFHGEVPEPEGEPEPEAEPEAEAAEPEGEPEEEYVRSFPEFLEAEGLDPEFMDGLAVPVKVNGEIREIPFTEIRAHAQKSLATNDALEQAKEVKRAAQEERQQLRQAFDASVKVAGTIAQRAIAAVQQDMQALEQTDLRTTDPAEYSARKLALQERFEAEKNQLLTLAKGVQEETAKRAQQDASELQEQLARGAEKLVEAIPAWSNPEVAKRDADAVMAYVSNSGLFTEQQVRENTIPGLWVLAHKARLYDESQGAADVTQKRLRKVPRVAKPGAPKSPEQITQEKASAAQQRVRNVRGTDAQVRAAVEAKRLSRRK